MSLVISDDLVSSHFPGNR